MSGNVNRIAGTAYTRGDFFNRQKSIEMFRIYIGHYATFDRLGGVEPTDEDRSRTWNGGPNGWHRDSTLGYWERVKRELAKIMRNRLQTPRQAIRSTQGVSGAGFTHSNALEALQSTQKGHSGDHREAYP